MSNRQQHANSDSVEPAVCARDGASDERARALAQRLHAPLMCSDELRGRLVVSVGHDGLVLEHDGLQMRADLATMVPRVRKDRLGRELLVKAAKIKGYDGPLRAVDATAGLGQDALLLAAAGFETVLFEQNPVIAALLADSLERAAGIPELAEAIARMHFFEGDSIAQLHQMEQAPDVVLLDPMFPERRKSASVKKKFQLLHLLELPCADEGELLSAAFAAHPRKVVVKRPPKGPYLAGVKPSYSLDSKAVRYDVHVFARS